MVVNGIAALVAGILFGASWHEWVLPIYQGFFNRLYHFCDSRGLMLSSALIDEKPWAMAHCLFEMEKKVDCALDAAAQLAAARARVSELDVVMLSPRSAGGSFYFDAEAALELEHHFECEPAPPLPPPLTPPPQSSWPEGSASAMRLMQADVAGMDEARWSACSMFSASSLQVPLSTGSSFESLPQCSEEDAIRKW